MPNNQTNEDSKLIDRDRVMAEEEDHEQDLQDYLNDIARMKAYILKK